MRKLSLVAVAVLAALSLSACNSTSENHQRAAKGPSGFKSAEVRFQEHPEAMVKHQADELSERTDNKHLYVFKSDKDEEEDADADAEENSENTDEATGGAVVAKTAASKDDSDKRTDRGFKSSELRYQEHPEDMTGNKVTPKKKELTAEQKAKLEKKRAEAARKNAVEDKVAKASEYTDTGFRSAEPRYQWNPGELTGKQGANDIVTRDEKYQKAAKRAGVSSDEDKAKSKAKTEQELEAEAVKKESNKFGFRSADPRFQLHPEEASK